MHSTLNVRFITEEDIAKSLDVEDLDEAVGRLMQLAGITDDAVASRALWEARGTFADEYDAWAQFNTAERRRMIAHWLAAEAQEADKHG